MARKKTAKVPPPTPSTFEDSFSTRSSDEVDDISISALYKMMN
jgi:hypothetical protein